MERPSIYAGIDVSQDHLDVAVVPDGKHWRVPHTDAGVRALGDELKGLRPALVVMEATGGLHEVVLAHLTALKLPAVAVNPRQVKHFGIATGRLAKTDAIDAQVLALFAERMKPEVRALPDTDTQAFGVLLARRRQLVEMLIAEKQRRRQAPPAVQAELREHIAWLQRRIKTLDKDLGRRLRESPVWREQDDLLRSVPGVGDTTVKTLVAELSELGRLSHKKMAALAGVAPFNRESGKRRGKQEIAGGREPVRAMLYMAALAATRHNPVIRSFYQRLLGKGKHKKVALVACMHKLLTILNAIMKHKTPWSLARAVAHG